MQRPVICHVMDYAAEYSGTFVEAVLALARHCRETLGLEMLCVFPEAARERSWLERFRVAGVRYGFVPRRRDVVFGIRAVLGNDRPAIIHCHFTLFDIAAALLKFVAYRQARVIWHFHEIGHFSWSKRITDAVKIRWLARCLVDQFIAVGDGAYRFAIERGVPPARLAVIRNGVNVARFSPSAVRRIAARRVLAIPDESKAFLLLGWEPKRKGVDIFVKAASEFARRYGRPAVFLVVGRQETSAALAELPEAAALGPALRMIEPREDFSALLDAVDVFVLASRSEGLPAAVVEAMAGGKVVLSSDIPGVREIAKSDGVWLFPSENWLALMELMSRAWELPTAARDELGRINARHAADHLSLEAWTRQVGDLYRTLLDADEPPSTAIAILNAG